MSTEQAAEQITDWQVSHNENQGRATVIVNFMDSSDDVDARQIVIKGRGHARFADLLAALLQDERVSSVQA